MKFLIASDIHGDVAATKEIIRKFSQYKCDKMILLGDYLSGGSYEDYEKVIDLLNFFKNDIIAIRGNCDYFIGEDIFEFELRDKFELYLKDRLYIFEHGHQLESYYENPLNKELYVIYGHTHRLGYRESGGIHFINLSSVSTPRGSSPKSFAILDDEKISIFDFDDNLLSTYWFIVFENSSTCFK